MSTALYRRYRPESFADVIGQEHVTEPLMAALSKNRVNHAYLFSGPRGCGKTTSARILARCLNCAQGPTPTPCGTCDSCVELARNGAGSLDVIEIDAASHGGVDDARDLRERATFAPVRDRYKIFIIDEAHMVTSAGFNALLKIVEEPPEHIKFIFATTEPDKVIGTIRSRTHHYPFRLVPPEPLLAYLEKLCVQEGVPVAPGVLSLVIRAGGGSVRDSLSVLDQLMAGAGESGLDYELAVNLLGYTHVALLDDVVDAFAAGDAATVFSAVDRVIQTGQDPRRFVEDLLERFRDLIVVNAMPDAAAAVLRGVPEDQINRMRTQAAQFGGAELSRAADITNTALTEMTGATSPRLHLELLCARILLPAADQSERGTAARVDRIERRLSYAGDAAPATAIPQQRAAQAPENTPSAGAPQQAAPQAPSPAAPAPAPAAPEAAPAAAGAGSGTDSNGAADWGGTWATPAAPAAPAASGRTWDDVSMEAASQQQGQQSAQQPGPAADVSRPQGPQPAPDHTSAPSNVPSNASVQPPAAVQSAAPAQQGDSAANASAAPSAAAGPGQVEMIRRAWPEIMDALTSIRRATWLNVSKNASPRSFDGRVLELAFSNPGAATNFNRPDHLENLRKAIHQVLGVDCQVNAVHDSSASAGEPGPKAGSRLTTPAQTPAPASAPAPRQAAPPVPQAAPAPAAPPAPADPQAVPATAAQAQTGGPERPSAGSGGLPTTGGPSTGAAPFTGGPASGVPAADGPAAGATAWNIPPASPARAEPEATQPAPAGGSQHTAADRAAAQASPAQAQAQAAPQPAPARSGQERPQPAPRPQRSAPAAARNTAPLPEDWPQEPSEPADVPESNAWETAAVPDDIHVSSAVSDEEWATTNWAGTTAVRPGTGSGTPVHGAAGSGRGPAPQPAAHGSTASPSAAQAPDAAPKASSPNSSGAAPAAAGASAYTAAPGTGGNTAPRTGAPANAPGQAGQSEVQRQPAPGQKLSRYQQLLNEAAQRGGGAPAAAARGNVDLAYVEDVPSADDVTLEDSGLVGRKAIERILGGRLIEERSLDGHGVHR